MTKVDRTQTHIYRKTRNQLDALLKTHFQLMLNHICDEEDAIRTAEQLKLQYTHTDKISQNHGIISTHNLVPIIDISAVTEEGFDILKKLLYRLEPRQKYSKDKLVEFYIEKIYESVEGIGLVVSGLLTSGTVNKGDILNIGPDSNGNYTKVKIKSIHCDHRIVNTVDAGNHCSFALSKVNKSIQSIRDWIKKDMVLIDDLVKPMAFNKFKLKFKMLRFQQISDQDLKKITLGIGSKFTIQSNNIRRSVVITDINSINGKEIHNDHNSRIKVGDFSTVDVELEDYAYLKKGDTCILTESYFFGMGNIVEIIT